MKAKSVISYLLLAIGIIIGVVSVILINNMLRNTTQFTGEPFGDARNIFANGNTVYSSDVFNPNYIQTYWFNADNVFLGSEELASFILEAGKNPGLGVRALHEHGITGEGVRVAIIDQNMALTHPEYINNLAEYRDFGTGQSARSGSMHGAAVASLLVGDECGTAPGAVLYYAAAPSWKRDSQHYADALRWIIEVNNNLPEDDKIRVVSISAAPSGEGTPFTSNTEQWDEAVAEATAAGILVLDCRQNTQTGFIAPAYLDLNDPDNITLINPGYPNAPLWEDPDENLLHVPNSRRTMAEEYNANENSWQYTGMGGLSWAIPYAAGVLAMGWQINPNLENNEIISLLFATAYIDNHGYQFINPTAFIEAVRATQ